MDGLIDGVDGEEERGPYGLKLPPVPTVPRLVGHYVR